jgi:diacylglycerol kinase (ATP)
MARPDNIRLIINPAAGHHEPILNIVNQVFSDYAIHWDVAVTLQDGDGKRLAQQAVADGVELVVAYGGDGTVKDVANGLVGSDVPMGILHGGTGNAMAYKLNIPTDLGSAARLLMEDHQQLALDMGKVSCVGDDGEDVTGQFALRASIGMQNDVLARATSELKSRFGNMAYVMAAFDTFNRADAITYRVCADNGEETDLSGLTCVIANAATIGGTANFDFAPQVSPFDGELNLFVFNHQQHNNLVDVLKSHLDDDISSFPGHIAGKQLRIETDTPQTITIDGELLGKTPGVVDVVPGAVQIIVPGKQ